MTFLLTNSSGKRKEPFTPLKNGIVKMYTCGPTVYDYAHIGNFRTFVFEDLLRRYLRLLGFQVYQVMNLTDVDDKTIKASRSVGVSLREYTEKFAKAFFEDLDMLRIERAEVYPRATEHVQEMVELVKKLLEKGYAYRSEGSIYFDVSRFEDYGKLSQVVVEGKGLRVKADDYSKEQARDFALWKSWDEEDGEVFWETELGKGRPGWHIECSAMSMKYLGETFDIHAGGVDLIFPHHENEIAQSEAATGKPFVKFWVHSEHLVVEGQKMSKSLGNYYTLRDLLERGYDSVAIRFLLLSTQYKSQLNFTFESLRQAESSVARIRDFYRRLSDSPVGDEDDQLMSELTSKAKQGFNEAMSDDLNVPRALGILFDYVRDVNRILDKKKVSERNLAESRSLMEESDRILDVIRESVEGGELPVDAVEKMVQEREEARRKKDWAEADRIRTLLQSHGIVVEDTSRGPRWSRRRPT